MQDPAIPTDSLTADQVLEPFPHLLDELTDTLCPHGGEVEEHGGWEGEDYGAARWHQGFELPEMLRELTHFRSILIERLRICEENNEDFRTVLRPLATTTLRPFLKRMGIDATQQFLTEGLHEREIALAVA